MKYKDRYVLATGYPWFDLKSVSMYRGRLPTTKPIELAGMGLLDDRKCPRYRLVLERVKRGGKR